MVYLHTFDIVLNGIRKIILIFTEIPNITFFLLLLKINNNGDEARLL